MTDHFDRTYSSADIELLLAEIPAQLQEAAVPVSPVHYTGLRQPDMLFTHPAAELGAVLDLIRQMRPRVVFLEASRFDTDEFIDANKNDIPGIAELRRQAQQYVGEPHEITLTWAADGLISTWFATTGWYDDLVYELEIATQAAEGIDEIDRGLRQDQTREQFSRCKSLILADPGFRGASVNKRSVIARTLLTSHGEELDDRWMERHLLQEVRQEASIAVAQQEQTLATRVAELAEQLVTSDLWVDVRTQARQKAAVAEFVVAVADGWMLSEEFREALRDAALQVARSRKRW